MICVGFVAGVGIEGGWTNYNHPPPTPDHLSYSFFRTRPSPLAGVCYTCSRGVKPAAGVCYTCRRGLLYLQQGSVIPASGVCYTCSRGLHLQIFLTLFKALLTSTSGPKYTKLHSIILKRLPEQSEAKQAIAQRFDGPTYS